MIYELFLNLALTTEEILRILSLFIVLPAMAYILLQVVRPYHK